MQHVMNFPKIPDVGGMVGPLFLDFRGQRGVQHMAQISGVENTAGQADFAEGRAHIPGWKSFPSAGMRRGHEIAQRPHIGE